MSPASGRSTPTRPGVRAMLGAPRGCRGRNGESGGWDSVDRIAVGLGPGTFTGLRIGIATARGLAQSSGLELAAFPRLRALAAGSRGDEAGLAVIDAKRDEVFAALYEGEDEVWEASVGPPGDLADRVRGAAHRHLRSVTAQYAFVASSKPPGPRSRPMKMGRTGCERGTSASSPRVLKPGRSQRSSRPI